MQQSDTHRFVAKEVAFLLSEAVHVSNASDAPQSNFERSLKRSYTRLIRTLHGATPSPPILPCSTRGVAHSSKPASDAVVVLATRRTLDLLGFHHAYAILHGLIGHDEDTMNTRVFVLMTVCGDADEFLQRATVGDLCFALHLLRVALPHCLGDPYLGGMDSKKRDRSSLRRAFLRILDDADVSDVVENLLPQRVAPPSRRRSRG